VILIRFFSRRDLEPAGDDNDAQRSVSSRPNAGFPELKLLPANSGANMMLAPASGMPITAQGQFAAAFDPIAQIVEIHTRP
jgi:hypothetical protein